MSYNSILKKDEYKYILNLLNNYQYAKIKEESKLSKSDGLKHAHFLYALMGKKDLNRYMKKDYWKNM